MVLLACGGCSGTTSSVAPAGSPSTETAAPAAATPRPLPAGVQARIETGATPESALDAFGSIWVSDHRPGRLSRIDPATNKVIATVEVGGGHIGPALEAAGKVWVMTADESKIVAIDPATNQTLGSIDCGCEDEGGLTWVGGVVWFQAPDGMWWQIDPHAYTVIKKVKGIPITATVVVAERWFGIDDARVLHEFDPATGKAEIVRDLRTDLGAGALFATTTDSSIWFSSNDGTIARYEVLSDTVSRGMKLDLGRAVSDPLAPLLMAATSDAVYLRPSPGAIVHVDPRTGQIVKRFEGMPYAEYPSYITVAYGSLWVPQFSDASVWRVALEVL